MEKELTTYASMIVGSGALSGIKQVRPAGGVWAPSTGTLSPTASTLTDSQLIFELIQRGYAVALVPAETLAEELGA